MAELSPWWKVEAPTAGNGREAELSAVLREHDEALSAGRARVVFVRGPQGVGKSHFFGLIRRALAERGVAVIEGGSGREVKKTFGLFAPMIPALSTQLQQLGVPQAKVAELIHTVAGLTGPSNRSAPNGGQPESPNRVALFDAVGELFALAGRETPAFLFPDLDQADQSSLELLRYLLAVARTPNAKPGGLFVLSFRDGALPKPLEEIAAKVTARSLPLSGLDLDGIRAFLSQKEIAQRLLERTGGNPQQLAQLLERPAEPVDLFLRRATQLSTSERSVLEVLAVSPDALKLDALAAVLAQPAETIAPVLDALVKAHLVAVKVTELKASYRFAREAEKTSLAGSVAPEAQRSLRTAIARALVQDGELERAARLLLETQPTEGAALAFQAADQLAARGGLEAAIELYRLGLEHHFSAPAAAALGRASFELGDFKAAARAQLWVARRSLGEARENAALDAAKALLKRGKPWRVERVLTAVPAGVSKELLLAELSLLHAQPAEVIARVDAVLAGSSTPEARLTARNLKGKALLLQGQSAQAEAQFEANAIEAAQLSKPVLAALARLNQGVAAHKRGDRERAVGLYTVSAEVRGPAQGQAQANLGSLYADSGDFDPALEHLTKALQTFSRFGTPREVALVASNLARLHLFLGDTERGVELSEHALALADELGETYLCASALLNLGSAQLDRRDFGLAARTLDLSRARFEQVGNDGYAALAAALKARAHLGVADRAQASLELEKHIVQRGAAQLAPAAVEVELTQAELALGAQDLLGATRAAARAKDALLAQPDLEGPFRVHHLLGRLKQTGGDAVGAQAEFARAGRALDELTQRVPPARRQAFLSVPRRSEVLASVEPELRLPKPMLPRAPERALGLIGRSPLLQTVVRQLEPVGRSNATVLIRGESGTGKELLAEAIHQLSPRRSMPLVKVNCAAMVEDLLLSELFGHEKGAFTGAVRERKGRFELADGGTLFLDEIGDITPKCQVALLRVLQEREFERVGGTKTLKVDVRVICATNRDLEGLIAEGRFRSDLYYRLKGVMLALPSLRERLDDLPVLSSHFLERIGKERGEPVKRLNDESVRLLARHTWPGNVRELENVLSAATLFAEGPVVGPDAFMHVSELKALALGAPIASLTPVGAPSKPAGLNGGANGHSVAQSDGVAHLDAIDEDDEGDDEQGDDVPSGDGGLNRPASGVALDFYQLARERGLGLKEFKHQIEVQCIKRALVEANGNISEAARLLRMKRSRLSQIVNAEPELAEVAHAD